ncbi:ATP-binding protein [Halovenus sp. HT40]|uniref:ATP-binding protein n=1 Tax=Halovenus sp. HT40 TaxID=3126691 RepID=UPI00300F18C7
MSQIVRNADEARHQLYEIMKRDGSFEQKAKEALELGKAYLDVDSGFLTRIESDTDHWETIVSTDGTDGLVPPGMKSNLSGTYCRHTLERDSPLALHDIPGQQTAVEAEKFDCYHGTTLTVNDEIYGTVCFVAVDARSDPFSEAETMFAELVGRLLEHEIEHERQRDQLARQTSLVNVLDRVLRHNIRNELTIIRANARLHGEKHEDCSECEQIVESTDQLIGMSETARQLGKSINAEFDRRPIDLVALVNDLAQQATESYSELSITVDAPDRLVVVAYPSVETALWELIENVAKHAGESPTATLRLRDDDEHVAIEIGDDGPGLPEAERDVLQTGTETQLAHGSGLGLWSVYWVAVNHRGDLDIDTTDGTRITLSLPRQDADLSDGGAISAGELQVARAGDRYETAFDAAPIGVVMLAENGQILEANDHAETLLDCPVPESAGKQITSVLETATGPLGDGSLADGTGQIEHQGHALDYRLTADVGSGQHLLVIQE